MLKNILTRWVTPQLGQNIANFPAVALLGARQVGKTTLARKIAETRPAACPAIYLDLESPEDLFKLKDPGAFLSQESDKDRLIILDEIQRLPDLFMVLRGIIDKNRMAGKKAAQFLLLGSAAPELLRQSESLAGRISYVTLAGINTLEIPNTMQDLQKLWLRGGFPESLLADNDPLSMQWLENLIRTYLERDIPQLGLLRIPANRLRRLWTMLAHLQGETINFSQLAANLEVDSKTVSRYIDILVDLLLVRRLEPWHNNVKKRLVKSPRFYVRDSGILHRLLGIANYDALLSNPILGKSWEGLVIENILSILPFGAEAYFYRTAAGAEIDLLLKLSNEKLWAVEIKSSSAPKIKSGFHQAALDVQATHKYVVYGGSDMFPIQHDTTVLSLPRFMETLSGSSAAHIYPILK